MQFVVERAHPSPSFAPWKCPAVVIPTYNEIENLEALVAVLHQEAPSLTIIVVDDNSPDGTGECADALAQQDRRIQVIHRPRKLGLGTAHIAGMRWALVHGHEPILTMDADFSHAPCYIPSMLAALQEYDVVIGSRYVLGGGQVNCSVPRVVLSRSANLFARTMLGLAAADATAGFRAYRRAVLESIDLDTIRSNGYSFLIEMLYACQLAGWRIGEIPIVFEQRRQGKSKISRREIFQALHTVIRLCVQSGHVQGDAGTSQIDVFSKR